MSVTTESLLAGVASYPGAMMKSSCDGNLLLHFSGGTTTPAHYDFSCAVDADIPNPS